MEHPVASTPPPPPTAALTLTQPSIRKKNKHGKVFRIFRNIFRSFPIIIPTCKFPSVPDGKVSAGSRVTGTLFGYRKGRVTLAIQQNSGTLPTAVVELALQTHVLQKEMSLGMVRIALECEKRAEKDRIELLDEPMWTMFCNGKKSGYGVKRAANEDDLQVMEMLKAVSMGAGVLPGRSEVEGPDGEMAYIRAYFDDVIASRDSETLYMLSPDGNTGPELSIFFVRV
ncbi:hypothetical protein ACS0TY_030535 [Phlomoides rotata]